MTELIEKAIDKIRTLPKAEQEVMAALILEKFPDKQQTYSHSREKTRRELSPEPLKITEHTIPENAEQLCEYIKELIETSHVSEARRIVSGIGPGVSEELDYWKKVLAEPVPRPGGPGSGRDMKKDMLWLENNADDYKGKWVALKSGVLLGSHESHTELYQTLKKSGRLTGTLFFRVGK